MKIIKYIVYVLLFPAAVALLTVTCVTVANICGRAFFQSPVSGAIEIAGMCGAVVVSFSLIYTQFEERNVSTSVLFDILPVWLQKILEKFTLVLSLGTMFLLAYSAAMGLHEAVVDRNVSAILTLYIWPFRAAWLGACVIFCAILFGQFIRAVIGVKNK